MPGMDNTRVLLKNGNESRKDMLVETDLVVESPVVPVDKLVDPLLTGQPRRVNRYAIEPS
jgi:hypothetical protein